MMRSKKKNRDPMRRELDRVFSERAERIRLMLFEETEQARAAREQADRAFGFIHGEGKRAKR